MNRELAEVAPAATPRRAVVLLSGGLDSSTVAAWALREGWQVSALSIDYGQRHRHELAAAAAVARQLGITDHVVLRVDLSAFGGSALVDESIPVPRDRSGESLASEIPATYVPARNTVFLSLALAFAEARGAGAVGIGVNAIDYSGYPDCRPEFIEAFRRVAALGTKAGVEGHPIALLTPLQALSKADIARLAVSLGLDVGLTTSCYDPRADGRPCGHCDACVLRAAGFAAAGLVDPAAGGS